MSQRKYILRFMVYPSVVLFIPDVAKFRQTQVCKQNLLMLLRKSAVCYFSELFLGNRNAVVFEQGILTGTRRNLFNTFLPSLNIAFIQSIVLTDKSGKLCFNSFLPIAENKVIILCYDLSGLPRILAESLIFQASFRILLFIQNNCHERSPPTRTVFISNDSPPYSNSSPPRFG